MVARLALAIVIVPTSILAAAGSLLVAARLSPEPAVFLGAGWAVLAGGISLAVLVATARTRVRRQARAGAVVAAVLGASVAAGPVLLFPLPDPVLPASPVAGMRVATLPTGSSLAYVRIAGRGATGADPIVFIHGGPGTPDMATDLRFVAPLAADGRDVVVYDQVGAGHSSRFDDPTGYSLDRDLADLEALLDSLGIRRAALIGHSYGGTLAAAFLVAHPDRVSKLVFLAPGAIRSHEVEYGTGMVDRLDPDQRTRLYAELLHPRALVGWLLTQVNVRAAHAFADDRELDARFDRTYALSAPGLVCDPAVEVPHPHGLGFYTNAVRREIPDLRAALRGIDVPALVLKPQCDYLPWVFGADIAASLPNAALVYVRDAGHSLHVERGEAVLGEIRAWLAGARLPIAPQPDLAVPADLRGPTG